MDPLHHNSFKDMMNDVVEAGSCCECGSCVVVCPHNVIEYIDGKPKQTAKASAAFDYCGISEGVGCDVCAAVCPRLWPRETHLRDAQFCDERPFEDIFGVYRQIFVARTRRDDVLARAQDGGIVTAMLAWAREQEKIDAAIVSSVGADDDPCFPSPKVLTDVAAIKASAGSWYTYCANNLALSGAAEQDLQRIAFVGVPCQITPIRKMQYMDPAFLVTARKKPTIVTRQRGFLRNFADRIAFNIGLFCTEVFEPTLMTEKIAKDMQIPLATIDKFNVKGKILIYKHDGEVATIPLAEAMADYQRPACRHCGDFSAELADIACGGVGTEQATIVVIRSTRGEQLWREFSAANEVQTWPIRENKRAWNILLRLARRQRERVPQGAARSGTDPRLRQYLPGEAANHAHARLTAAGKTTAEVAPSITAAYEDETRPEKIIGYMAGQPIPGDPGPAPEGEKRKLPPPPLPTQGGAAPETC